MFYASKRSENLKNFREGASPLHALPKPCTPSGITALKKKTLVRNWLRQNLLAFGVNLEIKKCFHFSELIKREEQKNNLLE